MIGPHERHLAGEAQVVAVGASRQQEWGAPAKPWEGGQPRAGRCADGSGTGREESWVPRTKNPAGGGSRWRCAPRRHPGRTRAGSCTRERCGRGARSCSSSRRGLPASGSWAAAGWRGECSGPPAAGARAGHGGSSSSASQSRRGQAPRARKESAGQGRSRPPAPPGSAGEGAGVVSANSV